jgi:GDSL-like Lipase/Acylhydrolase family
MSVYLALGDSISIDDYTGTRGGGAASRLARKLGLDLVDHTRDGNTTEGVLADLARARASADVVTLTAGGNELLGGELPRAILRRLDQIAERIQPLGARVVINTIYDPSDGNNDLGRREPVLSRLATIELRRRLNAVNSVQLRQRPNRSEELFLVWLDPANLLACVRQMIEVQREGVPEITQADAIAWRREMADDAVFLDRATGSPLGFRMQGRKEALGAFHHVVNEGRNRRRCGRLLVVGHEQSDVDRSFFFVDQCAPGVDRHQLWVLAETRDRTSDGCADREVELVGEGDT